MTSLKNLPLPVFQKGQLICIDRHGRPLIFQNIRLPELAPSQYPVAGIQLAVSSWQSAVICKVY
jgi:hypothetical protein